MAAQPQPAAALEQHDVWPLLLQHPALARRPRAVCALAATCRGLRAAVQQHCVGTLVLRVQLGSEQEAAQLARWLAPNGRLLRELRLRRQRAGWSDVSVVLLAAGLQQAAAAPCHLTRLELQLVEEQPFDSSHAAALAALTGLQQLVLEAGGRGVDPLLPALRGLSCLTALELSLLRSAAGVASLGQQLPVQLQRLTLGLALRPQRPPLELGRLSALTALSSSGSVNSDPLHLQPDDVLPPCLCELRGVLNCVSVAPLLPLARLRLLEVRDWQAPAEQLQQLSSVGVLGQPGGELRLAFQRGSDVNTAAAVWPLLALKSLGVSTLVAQLAAAALPHLATASGLTRVALASVQLEVPASRFAADVLVRLSRLEQLHLWSVRFQAEQLLPAPGGGQAQGEADAEQQQQDATQARGVLLCAAVAALPSLRALTLSHVHPERLCSVAAVAQLAAATGLTSLVLRAWPQLGGAGVAAVLPALGQLRHLGVPACGLTDAGLAVMAGLPGLTSLNLAGNSAVTDAGIACLIAGLPRLHACLTEATHVSPAVRERLTQHCARAAAAVAAAEADADAEAD